MTFVIVALSLALGFASAASAAPIVSLPAAPAGEPALVIRAQITPAAARVFAGGSLVFNSTVAGADDGTIAWSVIGAGTVGGDGVYHAPSTPGGRAIVVATARGASAAAAVTIVAPPPAARPVMLVACYGDGSIDVRDAANSESIGTTAIGGSADGIAADARAHLAVIGGGDRVGIFDPTSGSTTFSAPVSGARFSEVALLAGGYAAATDNLADAGRDGVRIFGPVAIGRAPALAGSVPAGDTPEGVAVAADGRTFYVTNVNSNSVMRFAFDARGDARLTGAARTGHRPFGVAIDDARKLLFVADNDTATLSGTASNPGLEVFSLPSLRRVARIGTGSPDALPLGIAIDPAANKLFVTNEGDGDVAAFSIDPLRRLATLPSGRAPWLPAVDRERGLVHVPNAEDGTISTFDVRTLRPLDRAAPTCGYPTSLATE